MKRLIGVAAVLLVVDRASKIATMKGLLAGPFLGVPYPRFTLHENYGIAFDVPMPQVVTVALSVLLVLGIVMVLVWARTHAPRYLTPLSLLLTGAASNLYDRLRFGFVIDVIEVVPRSIWNLADILILIGIIMLLLRTARASNRTPQ